MEPELIEILKRIEARIGGLEERLDRTESKIDNMEKRLDRTESKIDKNTIMIEDLTKKVQIVAEVQSSHKEQNERQSDKIIETLVK